MKKLKLILGCLFVAATLFSVTACNQSLTSFLGGDDSDDEADSEQIVGDYITGTASNAKVNEFNDAGNKRNLIPLKTKHYGSRAKIVQTDLNANTSNGQMGYAFNVVYHKEGDNKESGGTYSTNTADFCLVAVTYAGSPIYYISSYRNITNLQGKNFGVAESKVFTSGQEAQFLACTDPCEYVVEALPSLIISGSDIDGKRRSNLTHCAYDDEAKTLTVAINVTANNDGSYTIDFYDPEDVIKSTGSWISSTKLAAITNKLTKTIPASATGYSRKTQTTLGVYANIYPGHTLKGNWRLSGIKGEAEVEEFED